MVSGVSTDDPQRFTPLLSKCFMDSDTEKKTQLGLSLFTEQYANIFDKFVHDVTLLVRQMQRSLTLDFHTVVAAFQIYYFGQH